MSYGESWCQVLPQGSVTSIKSTLSGAVCDVLRDLGLIPSPIRVCEEAGVACGDTDALMLAPPVSCMLSGVEEVLIGGKEVEKNVGGRAEGCFSAGGMRW